jgi:hypothetical protein
MSSTFNGPIRIFKRNNPTNDGTIALDNTGASVVSQQKAIVGAVATVARIPAGAIIHDIVGYFSTGATVPATINVTLGGTVVATLNDAAGITTATLTTAQAALLSNIGVNDLSLSYTAGAGAVGQLSVMYTARNVDGSITPVGEGYTNN